MTKSNIRNIHFGLDYDIWIFLLDLHIELEPLERSLGFDMKPIAILSTNREATIAWAVNELGVDRVQYSSKRLTNTKAKLEYVIIQEKEECLSWEFQSVIIAPDYESLEDVVRTRIR
jgi:hypothetical protein